MIPKNELPREKITKFGIESLSDLELISLVLGFGNKTQDVTTLAKIMLDHGNGLKGLSTLKLGELLSIKGVKTAKASKVLAIFEIARRVNSRIQNNSVLLKRPSEIHQFLLERLENNEQEQFFLILLNTQYRVINTLKLFIGSLDLQLVHPRDIFREAVKNNAKYIICAHNHPSGDLTPSQQDLETTRALHQLSLMLGIKLLDHLIISNQGYRSLKEENYF